jgi:hypothetical protein
MKSPGSGTAATTCSLESGSSLTSFFPHGQQQLKCRHEARKAILVRWRRSQPRQCGSFATGVLPVGVDRNHARTLYVSMRRRCLHRSHPLAATISYVQELYTTVSAICKRDPGVQHGIWNDLGCQTHGLQQHVASLSGAP